MHTERKIIDISGLTKTYGSGFEALKDINLQINEGEIFALLGPNGAGKTTLISIICGLVNATSGTISVAGFDHEKEYRDARKVIGLVPQEVFVDIFLTVYDTMKIQRGFYGRPYNAAYIEKILKQLSLWDKKDTLVQELSGGMKRRVLIGKALMNEPKILFLDEPTAGVDVELRRSMWDLVWDLKKSGTTIILTTHYIEEAEEMADRIGVMTDGEIKIVERKRTLMEKLGSKSLSVTLSQKLVAIPSHIKEFNLEISDDKQMLTYTYKAGQQTGITKLLAALKDAGIVITNIETHKTSLEDIFVDLIHKKS